MDPHASSGKFLRVNSRYPESFRFLCLWRGGTLSVTEEQKKKTDRVGGILGGWLNSQKHPPKAKFDLLAIISLLSWSGEMSNSHHGASHTEPEIANPTTILLRKWSYLKMIVIHKTTHILCSHFCRPVSFNQSQNLKDRFGFKVVWTGSCQIMARWLLISIFIRWHNRQCLYIIVFCSADFQSEANG